MVTIATCKELLYAVANMRNLKMALPQLTNVWKDLTVHITPIGFLCRKRAVYSKSGMYSTLNSQIFLKHYRESK